MQVGPERFAHAAQAEWIDVGSQVSPVAKGPHQAVDLFLRERDASAARWGRRSGRRCEPRRAAAIERGKIRAPFGTNGGGVLAILLKKIFDEVAAEAIQ